MHPEWYQRTGVGPSAMFQARLPWYTANLPCLGIRAIDPSPPYRFPLEPWLESPDKESLRVGKIEFRLPSEIERLGN